MGSNRAPGELSESTGNAESSTTWMEVSDTTEAESFDGDSDLLMGQSFAILLIHCLLGISESEAASTLGDSAEAGGIGIGIETAEAEPA